MISEQLWDDASVVAELSGRSIEGQIEFWAAVGRAIEPLLDGSRITALMQAGAVVPLSACFAKIESDVGRRRVAEFLESGPFPHFQAIPASDGMLIRVDEDGTRTIGRFVGREFRPAEQ